MVSQGQSSIGEPMGIQRSRDESREARRGTYQETVAYDEHQLEECFQRNVHTRHDVLRIVKVTFVAEAIVDADVCIPARTTTNGFADVRDKVEFEDVACNQQDGGNDEAYAKSNACRSKYTTGSIGIVSCFEVLV
jgi:hypothetical protein